MASAPTPREVPFGRSSLELRSSPASSRPSSNSPSSSPTWPPSSKRKTCKSSLSNKPRLSCRTTSRRGSTTRRRPWSALEAPESSAGGAVGKHSSRSPLKLFQPCAHALPNRIFTVIIVRRLSASRHASLEVKHSLPPLFYFPVDCGDRRRSGGRSASTKEKFGPCAGCSQDERGDDSACDRFGPLIPIRHAYPPFRQPVELQQYSRVGWSDVPERERRLRRPPSDEAVPCPRPRSTYPDDCPPSPLDVLSSLDFSSSSQLVTSVLSSRPATPFSPTPLYRTSPSTASIHPCSRPLHCEFPYSQFPRKLSRPILSSYKGKEKTI